MQPEAVVAVVRRGDERVLIIQRAPSVAAGGYWAPPSGRIEPGESKANAVVREVCEEVGLTVRPVRCVWECLTHDKRYRLHWWLAEYVSGVLSPAPGEVSEALWLKPDEFASLQPTFADDRYFFDHVYAAGTADTVDDG